jgi:hypothetical protein
VESQEHLRGLRGRNAGRLVKTFQTASCGKKDVPRTFNFLGVFALYNPSAIGDIMGMAINLTTRNGETKMTDKTKRTTVNLARGHWKSLPHVCVCPNFYEVMGEDGPYTAKNFGVTATNKRGNRWHHSEVFRTEDAAHDFVSKIDDHLWLGGELNMEHWHRGDPVYGSDAYCEEGGEEALAKADVEAEYGPGSYTPDHPGYIG